MIFSPLPVLSFVYPIDDHYLQPFPPPCSQPGRNVAFHPQQFELVDMGLVGRKGGEGWRANTPSLDAHPPKIVNYQRKKGTVQ